MHANHCLSDIDSRMGLDLFHYDRIGHIAECICTHRTASFGDWNNRDRFPSIFFSSLPLDRQCAVDVLTALKRQKELMACREFLQRFKQTFCNIQPAACSDAFSCYL